MVTMEQREHNEVSFAAGATVDDCGEGASNYVRVGQRGAEN